MALELVGTLEGILAVPAVQRLPLLLPQRLLPRPHVHVGRAHRHPVGRDGPPQHVGSRPLLDRIVPRRQRALGAESGACDRVGVLRPHRRVLEGCSVHQGRAAIELVGVFREALGLARGHYVGLLLLQRGRRHHLSRGRQEVLLLRKSCRGRRGGLADTARGGVHLDNLPRRRLEVLWRRCLLLRLANKLLLPRHTLPVQPGPRLLASTHLSQQLRPPVALLHLLFGIRLDNSELRLPCVGGSMLAERELRPGFRLTPPRPPTPMRACPLIHLVDAVAPVAALSRGRHSPLATICQGMQHRHRGPASRRPPCVLQVLSQSPALDRILVQLRLQQCPRGAVIATRQLDGRQNQRPNHHRPHQGS
mmetsp:Transcript_12344/g.24481  ORF Transcript_12344/g.24481 Transcript_12344/m.24481 type:complete len:363 (-) Transcript_12344:24-1112(-)